MTQGTLFDSQLSTSDHSRSRSENCFDVPVFIKWAGGKTQLLPQFKPLLPDRMERYFEPFLGSGAVFFFVKRNLRPRDTILSDNTGELINCFEAVRDRVTPLIGLLVEHRERHSREYYYRVRATDPATLTPLERAARFLYLNKTCFNGLYRVNSRGQFNVPMGSYKNPNVVNRDSLERASEVLQGVHLIVRDFCEVVSDAGRGDFVYFDPPYHPLSSTSSFTGYTSSAFPESEQKRLSEVYRSLDAKGCLLAESNSDTELIRALYRGFRIETVMARRAINSDASKRGRIPELVILNY